MYSLMILYVVFVNANVNTDMRKITIVECYYKVCWKNKENLRYMFGAVVYLTYEYTGFTEIVKYN